MVLQKLGLFGLLISITCCGGRVENTRANEVNPLEKDVNDFVAEVINDYNIGGGIGIGIVKEGEILLEKAYGYSDRDLNIQASSQTPFYIASITKSFVGTLAMMLHENGEIDLEEELQASLPFKFSSEIEINDVLVEDLFTHTSGIGNSVVPIKTAYTGGFTKEEIFQDFEQFSYPITPGYSYSNLGYIIGAIIFEEKLGVNWKELLKQRLFDPLEMKNTSANVSTYLSDKIAKPHTLASNVIQVGDFLKKDDTMHAAGGLFTTVEDMNKWMNFHLSGSDSLLSKEAFDYIHSDIVGYYGKSGTFNNYGYGLGWNQADWNEYGISWHGGGYPGYRSLCILVPDEKLGITILMNQVTPAISLLSDFLLGNLLEVPDFENYLSERKNRITNQWNRYQFVRDSTLEAGTKKTSNIREIQDYEGSYLDEEYGEIIVKSNQNSISLLIGNLSFDTNYMGDDRFFFFSDADQMYGTMDFYFHSENYQQASSLDFSGVEYKRVTNKGQNN